MGEIAAKAQFKAVSEPCRNFNILGTTVINDPKDGKEKLVLSNFAAGAVGNIIFIDTQTGEGEALMLPGDEGAWALLNLNNEKLLVGTCAGYGYLHCLDLKTRLWAKSLRDNNEQYIWNLTVGSDGMVYGGTYPGCVLLRYDPVKHTLENMGRASDNTKNLYSRTVNGALPGYILVTGGMEEPFLAAFDIENKSFSTILVSKTNLKPEVKEITEEYIKVTLGKEVMLYDAKTFELKDTAPEEEAQARFRRMTLKDGRIAGVRGQEYFIKDKPEDKPVMKRIPVTAPATHIHTITSDKNGVIWGASSFGQTIFYYNPENDSCWNSPVVCSGGGEVYGMAFSGDELYLTAYSGGFHVVYDPTKAWNQVDNINPRTLAALQPTFIRPLGRSVIGPDGAVWTGWSTEYGIYGGGLSRIDTATKEVNHWYDPVKEQQIISVSADDRYIYFTTNNGGNGLPDRGDPRHFAVWAPEGGMICDLVFEKGVRAGVVQAVGGKVFVSLDDTLGVFDTQKMAFTNTLNTKTRVSCMLKLSEDTILAFSLHAIYLVDVKNEALEKIAELPEYHGARAFNDDLPGLISTAAITPAGDIYFARGTVLYKLAIN